MVRAKAAAEAGDSDEEVKQRKVRFEMDDDGNEIEVEYSDEEYDSDELVYDSEEEDEMDAKFAAKQMELMKQEQA